MLFAFGRFAGARLCSAGRPRIGLSGSARLARTLAAIALGCLLAVGSVRAHHSFAAFDMDKRTKLTGTLTTIDWRNPHIEISIEVKDDQGKMQVWRLEGGPPPRFRDRGITQDVFLKAVGQSVTVEAGLAKNGDRHGHMQTITWADGTTIPAR